MNRLEIMLSDKSQNSTINDQPLAFVLPIISTKSGFTIYKQLRSSDREVVMQFAPQYSSRFSAQLLIQYKAIAAILKSRLKH
ncbi:hypothetical protein ACOAPY_20585 [Pseudomonas sp. P3C3]